MALVELQYEQVKTEGCRRRQKSLQLLQLLQRKRSWNEHRTTLSFWVARKQGSSRLHPRNNSGSAYTLFLLKKTPHWLFILLAIVTTLLVSVHLLSLMISTCLLPYIEATGCTQDSPHIRLGFCQVSLLPLKRLFQQLYRTFVGLLHLRRIDPILARDRHHFYNKIPRSRFRFGRYHNDGDAR